jgi:wyosine [tRNA(Phe)-imidazoG37] synthetase (radical SAM superfamily)
VLRDAWVSPSAVAEELWATREVPADYVTFSGMGEPTLASNLADLLRTAREARATPLAVLTNASLLNAPSVQAALQFADYVIAKLDAADEEVFLRVNRPRIPCSLAEIIQGIRTFRQSFAGRLALQIMFVAANAGQAEVLAALARWLRLEEVQLNTPLRPTPTPPLARPEMGAIARMFDGLPVVQVYEAARVTVVPLDRAETGRRRPEACTGVESLVA